MDSPAPRPPTDPRFASLPRALAERAVWVRLGGDANIPALFAHPDLGWNAPGATPAKRPVVLWMHGRTANKELDPGRYLRWIRAEGGGIAACALDLPWHGERLDATKHGSEFTLRMVERMLVEIDLVVESLRDPRFNGAFDLDRMAIGGMSAGGMATLVRLCSPHRFRCAAVEATAGDFSVMKGHRFHVDELVEKFNPITHLDAWRPIPILMLHSRADAWVPVAAIENFAAALRDRNAKLGANPSMVELVTWDSTGAPEEHIGFGRHSNDAKNRQTEFFVRSLGLM